MRRTFVILALIVAATATAGAGSRTLTDAVIAEDIETIDIETGIGDVRITSRDDLDDVSVEVVLTPRRGGIFSSMRAAEREVAGASLQLERRDGELRIFIDPPADDERRFEERWTVEMPSDLAVTLDHGVGDISVAGLRSGLEIDSGVGDIDVDAASGDVVIDLGVGTAVVKAPASAVEHARGAGGVGDVELSVRGERMESGGFISDVSSWEGDGAANIEVSVGVGDVIIRLD